MPVPILRVGASCLIALAGAAGFLSAAASSAVYPVQVPVAVPESSEGRGGGGSSQVPIGTAVLQGVVTDVHTGHPIGRARVSLSGAAPLQASPAAPAPAAGLQTGSGLVSSMVLVSPLAARPFSRVAVTDAAGRFEFDVLAAGHYTIAAEHEGYLRSVFGVRRNSGPGSTVVLANGQRADVKISMSRGGVIAGSIFGDDGLPLVNAQVRASKMARADGFVRFSQVKSVTSDDRGAYRLFGLEPGDYLVSATPNANWANTTENTLRQASAFRSALADAQARNGGALPLSVFLAPLGSVVWPVVLPVYHPSGVSTATAGRVALGAGEERHGVDIRATLARAGIVRGSVAGLPPGLVAQVALMASNEPWDGATQTAARTGADGAFSLPQVKPGRYRLEAHASPATPATPARGASAPPPVSVAIAPLEPVDRGRYWAVADIVVESGETTAVTLALQPGMTVSGRAVLDVGVQDTARRALIFLTRVPTGWMDPVAPIAAAPGVDLQITFEGVPPGRYLVRSNSGIASAMIGGIDITDVPLEVTPGQDLSGLVVTYDRSLGGVSGVLTDARGAVTADRWIVLAPVDRTYWIPGSRRIAVRRTSVAGEFSFPLLPAGDYVLAAFDDLEQGIQYDADFLAAVATAGIRVVVPRGRTVRQDMRAGQ